LLSNLLRLRARVSARLFRVLISIFPLCKNFLANKNKRMVKMMEEKKKSLRRRSHLIKIRRKMIPPLTIAINLRKSRANPANLG
jgi:hypothetical protein